MHREYNAMKERKKTTEKGTTYCTEGWSPDRKMASCKPTMEVKHPKLAVHLINKRRKADIDQDPEYSHRDDEHQRDRWNWT